MKKRMKTNRFLILGVLLLSLILSACAPAAPQETSGSGENGGTTEAVGNENSGNGGGTISGNEENTNNGNDEKKEGFWSGEDLMFVANVYYKDPFMSSGSSMTIVVYDHRVYINDDWYHKITYTENMNLTYRKNFFAALSDSEEDNKTRETLEAIKNLKSCYILESATISSKEIAIYDLDGTYYFMEIDQNNEVYLICAGTVADQSYLTFYPKLYLRASEELSKWFRLSIIDGEIKLIMHPYKKATDIENLDVVYSDALLVAANGDAEVLKTLDTIKKQKPYCILKSTTDSDNGDFGNIVAIYKIDDTYYFLDYPTSGDISRIWKLSYGG